MSDAESPARSPEREPEHEDPEQLDDNDDAKDDGHDSDLLSEIDEDQFEDYNPDTANIEDRPVNIDEDVARTLKASKRKGAAAGVARKVKEGRRERKRGRGAGGDDDDDDGMDVDGFDGAGGARRPRKARRAGTGAGEGARRREASSPEAENEENLTPEERRRRALDRAMDAATKSKVKRRKKKDEIDLDDELDEQLAALKIEMERACEADNRAREAGQPALHKLKLLPKVISFLNRNNAQEHVLDPDTNFLQHVKFFLEPLNDGSLPAYNIQRDVFAALTRLPVEKETLLSSGIGKVVLFYTRSNRPEAEIKRMAERLVRDWSRPILKRTDDFKKRHVETRDFDYQAAKLAQRQSASSQFALAQRPAQSRRDVERERLLAPVVSGNRARIPSLPASYTVAPKSTFDPSRGSDYRPIGASGMEAFRKMTQKGKKRG